MVFYAIKPGLGKGLLKVFGSRNERVLKSLRPIVDEINEIEPEIRKLSDEQLLRKTEEFRGRIAGGESLEELLVEAFACVRESARRNTPEHMRPFDVQLIGALVLHRGMIAEMATGEGKTLVATMPLYLNALVGHSHLVTVNDYLARRDREWMGPVYEALGMTVGVIQAGMGPEERKPQYECDITYGTNTEFGFDYLRDNMKVRKEDQVQGSLDYAIVDEVDSVLIDEARTPLIISGPSIETADKYYAADKVARKLRKGVHYEVKEKEHQVILTEEGIEKAQEIIGVDSFYTGENMEWPHFIDNALRAHNLYKRDTNYIIKEGKVVIVDEFTGRLMPGRRWSDGLHQAVEAKEKLKIEGENQTLATITLQNFFRLYKKLAGMTGTAMTEAQEFDSIYKLETVSIPTNKPCIREDAPDIIYCTEEEKFNALVEEIENIHNKGNPILVGTTSVENSERLSKMLKNRGIKHGVLNAKHHAREAQIVAKAGQAGNVTVATNMAGRGTDIKLGPGVPEKGGLVVIGTERHEARRIDNQLRGRTGRQGDPGKSIFFVALEDTLMRRFAGDWVRNIMQKLGLRDGQDITSPMVSRQIQKAQKRVEEYNFSIRKSLLEYDEVMDVQRKTIYGIRQQILEGENLKDKVLEWIKDRIYYSLDFVFLPDGVDKSEWDYEGLANWFYTKFRRPVDADKLRSLDVKHIEEYLVEEMLRAYEMKEAREGEEIMRYIERRVMLETIDSKWKDHLYAMDYLRSAVSFKGYEQKDPKVVYKIEGSKMFEKMLDSIKEDVTELVFRMTVRKEDEEAGPHSYFFGGGESREFAAMSAVHQQMAAGIAASTQAGEKPQPIRAKKKVGRNDPCPCGSGKKYKKCCGRNA
ncbi:MAG: preprotein translocase subunit SecA [Planctomycetota bacterium]|nr:MAG: preprotein translocase subunit SecA [Planctomycetota bacterium]